jgi:hypothetical protein
MAWVRRRPKTAKTTTTGKAPSAPTAAAPATGPKRIELGGGVVEEDSAAFGRSIVTTLPRPGKIPLTSEAAGWQPLRSYQTRRRGG